MSALLIFILSIILYYMAKTVYESYILHAVTKSF